MPAEPSRHELPRDDGLPATSGRPRHPAARQYGEGLYQNPCNLLSERFQTIQLPVLRFIQRDRASRLVQTQPHPVIGRLGIDLPQSLRPWLLAGFEHHTVHVVQLDSGSGLVEREIRVAFWSGC